MWREKQIGDIANVIPSNVDKKSVPGQRKIKLCNYMDVYNNRYIHGELDFMVATAKADQIEKYKLLPDDVIITKDSETPEDIAVPAVVAENIDDLICGYHLAILRPKESVNGKFLMYRLCEDAVRRQFFRVANGSTRYGLTIGAIENVNLDFPEEPEQNCIVEILEATEDAIAATRAMLDKQDKIKDGLLQDLLTRGVDQNGKLRPTYADAPDLYKQSPLGFIPKDWDVKPISSVGDVITGHTPPSNDPMAWGDYIPFITPTEVLDSGNVILPERFVSNKGMKYVRRLPKGSILAVCIGSTLGKIGLVDFDCVTNQQINTVVCNKENIPVFIYAAIRNQVNQMHAVAGLQAVPIINKSQFSKVEIAIAPTEEQKEISEQIYNIETNINMLKNELAKLKKLKSGLMQDLLTGKKRISVKQKEAA